MDTKICTQCGEEKENSDKFFKLSGFIKKDGTKSLIATCRTCCNKYKAYLRLQSPTEANYYVNRKRNNPFKHMLYTIKHGAIRRGLQFELTTDFLESLYFKQNGKCHYTSIPLIFEFGDHKPDLISLDRIDSSIGYTEDNVVFCCLIVNYMKNKYSIEDLFKYSLLIVENYKRDTVELKGNINEILVLN